MSYLCRATLTSSEYLFLRRVNERLYLSGAAAAAAAAAVPGDVGGGSVACVLPTTRTLEAFSLMHAEGFSAVGVVAEPRGRLIDCLCVSDLRGMGRAICARACSLDSMLHPE